MSIVTTVSKFTMAAETLAITALVIVVIAVIVILDISFKKAEAIVQKYFLNGRV